MFKYREEFLIDGDRMKFLKNVGNRFQPNLNSFTRFKFLNIFTF
jgi:hypothetical protein